MKRQAKKTIAKISLILLYALVGYAFYTIIISNQPQNKKAVSAVPVQTPGLPNPRESELIKKLNSVSTIYKQPKPIQPPAVVEPTSPIEKSLIPKITNAITETPPSPMANEFYEDFGSNQTLAETKTMAESASPSWWVNSGAYLYVRNGVGATVRGELDKNDDLRLRYNSNNPDETDNGYHPQNIFRLILRDKRKNLEQEAYYKIIADNLSADWRRASSNALLLFIRYQDENNLYYAGIRVDGTAVIKKKINGEYYTLAKKDILPGEYNRLTHPNLLPKNKWLGLKCAIKDYPNGRVSIKLFTDLDNTGSWALVLSAADVGSTYGDKALSDPGYAGIWTDFMDVEFDNYSIKSN